MADAVAEAPAGAVTDQDVQDLERFRSACTRLREELRHIIVGQDQVVEEVLLAMFSRGHCLLEGVPGLAKTLLVRTLARVLSLQFHRIQFTPDLMPSDITGTEILREDKTTGHRAFEFVHGPLFANIVLADESGSGGVLWADVVGAAVISHVAEFQERVEVGAQLDGPNARPR